MGILGQATIIVRWEAVDMDLNLLEFLSHTQSRAVQNLMSQGHALGY